MNDKIEKKRGRPSSDTEAVNVRFDRQTLDVVDAWRRDQTDLPNRPEAIRRLISRGLKVTSKT